MSASAELLVGLALALGIAGTIVPLLPGVLIVAAAIVVWALVEGTALAWAVAAAALVVLGVGQVVKYLLPGRRLKQAGVPGRVLVVGGLVGVVGFFVLPVVGLPLGFVAGVYLAELLRLRDASQAWPSTREAMLAAGLSMLHRTGLRPGRGVDVVRRRRHHLIRHPGSHVGRRAAQRPGRPVAGRRVLGPPDRRSGRSRSWTAPLRRSPTCVATSRPGWG